MFPGAQADALSVAAYAIVGAPLDRSTSFYPGTRFGPERIREAGWGFEDYDRRTDQTFSDLGVVDQGDVRPWHPPEEYLSFLTGELRDVVSAEAVPLVLGGEHTVSVAGVRATEPEVAVCMDAHLDLRSSFEGDEYSHATACRHVRSEVSELVILGVRAGARTEWDRARTDADITAVPPEEVPAWLDTHGDRLASTSDVYLSVDIDVVDPAVAPATGTPEPFGLDATTLRDAVRILAPGIAGADIVEVNDRDDGQTATLAAKVLREIVFTHASHQ